MPPTQNEKILVVDESSEIVDLLANQVLAPMGYEVATAYDGATALQLTLRLSPDILITALDLPGLSGRDLLAALRSQGYETAVIALGPGGAESQVLHAFRLGAKDYLTKPLREAEVVAAIDRALSEVRLRRERQQLAERLAGANQQLEKRVKELSTLVSIGKAVTAVTNLGQLFTRLVEAAIFVTEAEVGWLLLADEHSGKLILRAAKNVPPTGGARLNQPWDDGVASLIMLSGEGVTLAGPALAKLRAGQVVKAAAAVPLHAREKVIGVLVVGNQSGRPFSERDQAMLSAVGDYAVIGLMNARLFQAMEARVQSLQAAHDEHANASRQKDETLQRFGQQLRVQLVQARGTLEQLGTGQVGALSALQAETVRGALERLDALRQLADELAPVAVPTGHSPGR